MAGNGTENESTQGRRKHAAQKKRYFKAPKKGPHRVGVVSRAQPHRAALPSEHVVMEYVLVS